jgi:hypothetical protein
MPMDINMVLKHHNITLTKDEQVSYVMKIEDKDAKNLKEGDFTTDDKIFNSAIQLSRISLPSETDLIGDGKNKKNKKDSVYRSEFDIGFNLDGDSKVLIKNKPVLVSELITELSSIIIDKLHLGVTVSLVNKSTAAAYPILYSATLVNAVLKMEGTRAYAEYEKCILYPVYKLDPKTMTSKAGKSLELKDNITA